MNICIDLSGRIEDTHQDTVIAFSNGQVKSILVSSRSKIAIQKLFRDIHKPKIFIIKTYVALIFLLLKDQIEGITSINIDKEYMGHENEVKGLLIELIRKNGMYLEKHKITFGYVGKQSGCHKKAIKTFRREILADIEVEAKDIMRVYL